MRPYNNCTHGTVGRNDIVRMCSISVNILHVINTM